MRGLKFSKIPISDVFDVVMRGYIKRYQQAGKLIWTFKYCV